MAQRILQVEGERWEVRPSGRVTQYTRDEFGLVFTRGTGQERVERVIRYSPRGSRSPEQSLAELSDVQLAELLRQSQPSWTAPETEYLR
jgi:hypothetical protein